ALFGAGIEHVFVDDDGPRPQRRRDQAKHHGLHDEMGGPEHAPESQIVRYARVGRGHSLCVLRILSGKTAQWAQNPPKLRLPQARCARTSADEVKPRSWLTNRLGGAPAGGIRVKLSSADERPHLQRATRKKDLFK